MDAPETVRAAYKSAEGRRAGLHRPLHHQGTAKRSPVRPRRFEGGQSDRPLDDGRPVTNTKLLAEAPPPLRRARYARRLPLRGPLPRRGRFDQRGGNQPRARRCGHPCRGRGCGHGADIALAEAYGKAIHICHVSTKTSVAMIRDAKRRGVRVTAETAPLFSLTDASLLPRRRLRMNRRCSRGSSGGDRGLTDGTLDAVATDHAPTRPPKKARLRPPPNGSIGMETSLAAGITHLVKPGHLSLAGLLWKMSAAPAKSSASTGG